MILAATLAALSMPAFQRGEFTNTTPETRRLGLARVAFFDTIMREGNRHPGMDYVGYRSMLMVDHTTMLWPIGRADEVVFLYGRSDDTLVTYWRLVNGVARRQFQIACKEGKRKFPYGGTMSEYLGMVKTSVPKRYAKPLKSLLQARRAYASYIESAGMGVFYCTVIRPDGSRWPDDSVSLEFVPQQNNQKVPNDGIGITEEEQRLIARQSSSSD